MQSVSSMCSPKMLLWFSSGCGISYVIFKNFIIFFCIVWFFTVNVTILKNKKKTLFLKKFKGINESPLKIIYYMYEKINFSWGLLWPIKMSCTFLLLDILWKSCGCSLPKTWLGKIKLWFGFKKWSLLSGLKSKSGHYCSHKFWVL